MSTTAAPYSDGAGNRKKHTNGQTTIKLSDQLSGAGAPVHDNQPDGVNPQPIQSTVKAATRKAKQGYHEVTDDITYATATAANAGREISDATRAAAQGLEDASRRSYKQAFKVGRSARAASSAGAQSEDEVFHDPNYDSFGVIDKTVYVSTS